MVSDKLTADSIFLAAVELQPDRRTAYLKEACGNDPELLARVERLLDAQSHVGSFLESPAPELGATVGRSVIEQPGTVIGPYKLLQQIGEGGMGVVFMAEQTEPIQRIVALKIIKPGMDTRQVIARFEAERQALAMMDHPNIAKVLDAGTTDTGRPYFVMDLVKGVPITKYCDEKQLSLRERLELFMQVCQAVQHAHQKGIIHRDIKPTNVIVAEYDNHAIPKVIDFGVAKATAQKLTERTMFTEYGQVIGTVEYMSPEQAKLNQLDIDTRSDVYSLGVLLYELLTGATPFEQKRLREAAFDEVLRIIREVEPPRPSTRFTTLAEHAASTIAEQRGSDRQHLSVLLRGELDWIVMKCLEKDRNRRYDSASGLARDIERYLDDEPVLACPPSAMYRFRKLARRNKAALITTSGVVVGVLFALFALAVSNIRITGEKHQKDIALQEKAAALGLAQQQTSVARTARRVAERQRDAALENLYFAHMQVAHQDWNAGHLHRMLDLLEFHVPGANESDLRGWEWYYLLALAHRDKRTYSAHTDAVRKVAFSPDGRRFASGSKDRTIRIWDTQSGEVLNVLYGHERSVWDVAWSPDGKQLASAGIDGKVILWDVQTGTKLQNKQFASWISAVAWRPDGQRIAVNGNGPAQGKAEAGTNSGYLLIWDPKSGEIVQTLIGNVMEVGAVTWSPDGRWLATGADNWNGKIQIWNASTGELVQTLQGHSHAILAIVWSPDGRQFASTSIDRAIKFWEAETWKNLRVIDEAHRGHVASLSWRGDGKQIASAGEDGLVKIWDASNGDEVTVLRGHTASVYSVDWDRQNGRLISGSVDGTVKLWDLAIEPTFRTIAGYDRVSWSPDGRLLAARGLKPEGQQPSIDIFDATTGRKLFDFPFADNEAGNAFVGSLAWSPDGQKLAAALSRPGKVVVWDLATRREILSEIAHGLEARSIAWNPDSRLVASAGWDGVHLWNVEAHTKTLTFSDHRERVGSAVWSPNGKKIASRSWDNVVKIWNPQTGHTFLDLRHGDPALAEGQYALSWSPGGDRLAVGCYLGGEIIVWDAITGHQLQVIRGHTSLVRTLAWSPDGKRIASGGHDRYLKIWDAGSGRELLSLPGHRSRIASIMWRPDGQQIATADEDDVKIWDASIGYRLAPEWENNATDK